MEDAEDGCLRRTGKMRLSTSSHNRTLKPTGQGKPVRNAPLGVKTCLDVVNTPMCYGCTNPSMSCAGIASGSVQLGLVLRFFKDSWACSVRSWTFWPCPHLIRQGQTRVLRLWAAPAPVSAGIARGSGRAVRSCRWEFPRILEIALSRSLWRARRTAAANIVFWQAGGGERGR